MADRSFKFKNFTIDQHLCGMKVGTDGVLLGAWAPCEKAKRVLDVGTGTGLIALMLAQRNEHCTIEAIDINDAAVEQSAANFQNSPWSERLRSFKGDFANLNLPHSFDLVVSNPPFFANGLRPQRSGREEARMASFLPIEVLVSKSAGLLTTDGIMSVILPASSEDEILKAGHNHGLLPARITDVIPKPGQRPKRVLISLTNNADARCVRDELMIENQDRHEYTAAYKALTKSFYLKF